MLLIALALSTSMPANRWLEVGQGADTREYVDRESVRRSGSSVTLWTQRNLVPEGVKAWNEYELDCARRTAAILAWVRDEGGVVSHNVVRPHRAAAAIAPGTTEDAIFKLVCR